MRTKLIGITTTIAPVLATVLFFLFRQQVYPDQIRVLMAWLLPIADDTIFLR